MIMKQFQKGLSRRDFMRGAVLAGAAGVVGAALPGCATGQSDGAGKSSGSSLAGDVSWDKEADVVVLGTGASGLTSAIVAAQAGASVLVLEKASQDDEGGNTRVSGNCWTVPEDPVKGLEYYIALACTDADSDYLKELATTLSTINDDFIVDLPGMDIAVSPIFSPEVPTCPGGDTLKCYVNKEAGSGLLWQSLRDGAAELEGDGVEFLYETPGIRPIVAQDGSGMVLGVVADQGGTEINVKAKKGVILATGGYEFNYNMIRNSYPGWPTYSRGTPYNTGDGIRIATKAGAQLWHMNAANAGGCAMKAPGLDFGHGAYDSDNITVNMSSPAGAYLWVDQYGRRFMDETRTDSHGYGKREYVYWFDGLEVEWPRLPYWTIFDDAAAKAGPVGAGANRPMMPTFTWFAAKSGYEWSEDNSAEVDKGWILKADTVEELAQKMTEFQAKIDADQKLREARSGIVCDPAVLAATVEAYNAACAAGSDDEFGRKADTLQALGAGPYYAFAGYPTQYNTQGGPKRNVKAQTLDAYDEPIPHLYSVGENGAGWGWVYNGGFNIAECFATGTWAGTNAAAETAWDA